MPGRCDHHLGRGGLGSATVRALVEGGVKVIRAAQGKGLEPSEGSDKAEPVTARRN